MGDDQQRRLMDHAFYQAQDLAAAVRKPRKTTIKNDKFSCLVTCICGHSTLMNGEVEHPIFGGYCEGCARPLPGQRRAARGEVEPEPNIVVLEGREPDAGEGR